MQDGARSLDTFNHFSANSKIKLEADSSLIIFRKS
jgi:hypothetical protein